MFSLEFFVLLKHYNELRMKRILQQIKNKTNLCSLLLSEQSFNLNNT